ncbi:MAG: MaoC/PaaZ C-terminal domain-containing protein [Pseudomonadota bacterium]
MQKTHAQNLVLKLLPLTLSKKEVINFASQFDPIYFHLDEILAKQSMLGGLSASGFHTCSLAMKMLSIAWPETVTDLEMQEVKSLKWLEPVRPDDVLSGEATIIQHNSSSLHPTRSLFEADINLQNQNHTMVLQMKCLVLTDQNRSTGNE